VGLPLSQPVFHPTSFTKNRQRLLTTAVAEAFFAEIREQAEVQQLLSREHFSVDGTLLEAAAALWEPAAHRRGRRRGSPRRRRA